MHELCKSVVEWEAKSCDTILLGNGIKANNEVERDNKPILAANEKAEALQMI